MARLYHVQVSVILEGAFFTADRFFGNRYNGLKNEERNNWFIDTGKELTLAGADHPACFHSFYAGLFTYPASRKYPTGEHGFIQYHNAHSGLAGRHTPAFCNQHHAGANHNPCCCNGYLSPVNDPTSQENQQYPADPVYNCENARQDGGCYGDQVPNCRQTLDQDLHLLPFTNPHQNQNTACEYRHSHSNHHYDRNGYTDTYHYLNSHRIAQPNQNSYASIAHRLSHCNRDTGMDRFFCSISIRVCQFVVESRFIRQYGEQPDTTVFISRYT